MKHTASMFALFVLLAFGGWARGAVSNNPQSATARDLTIRPAHRVALDRFRAQHGDNLRGGDLDAMARYWSEGVRVMPEYHPTLRGRDEARTYFAALQRRFDIRAYARAPIGAIDLGSKVIEIGRFTWTLTRRDGGPVHEVAGKYMDIWEKGADGALSLATVAWNHDRYWPVERDLRFLDVPGVRMAFEKRLPVKDALTFELAALNELHEAAVSQHDAKVWAMFYADDVILLANHNIALEGRQALDAYIAQHAKELPVFEKLDIRNDRAEDLGGYVIEYASHVANWRNGDDSGVNTGKNIRIWRREPDCSLRIVWGIGMYD